MKRFNLTSVSNDRGFTLIEILIAITIMAFMTMGVVSITQNAADTMDRTTVLNKNNLQIETALSRFEWDFSQIYSPMYFSSVLNLASAASSITIVCGFFFKLDFVMTKRSKTSFLPPSMD
jgi:prepilin-type N-terminal cleavage/methylation domain-containing protein